MAVHGTAARSGAQRPRPPAAAAVDGDHTLDVIARNDFAASAP